MYRQGDVLIMPMEDDFNWRGYRKDKQPAERIVVQHGEATGHAHALPSEDAVAWRNPNNDGLVFKVINPTELTHEEHDPIPLRRGWYRVVRQREYDPRQLPTRRQTWGVRYVID